MTIITDTSGCVPTPNNLAVYLQGVSVETSSNLTSEYFVTATLPSSKVNRRVWQFESQGTITGPVDPTNSIFLLDYTEAYKKCSKFNITFEGFLNGTLLLHNQTFSANKFMSYRRVGEFTLELKFDRFPRSIVECYGSSSTQPFYFSIYINDAAANPTPRTIFQPKWVLTCLFPVITAKTGTIADCPEQLHTYSDSTTEKAGFFLLDGQTIPSTSYSPLFGNYYRPDQGFSSRILPDMRASCPFALQNNTGDQLVKVGKPMGATLTDFPAFVSFYYRDLTPCCPQHTHSYGNYSETGTREVNESAGGIFATILRNVRNDGLTTSEPQSVSPVNMFYSFIPPGVVTSYYVIANNIQAIEGKPVTNYIEVFSDPSYLFLSTATQSVYYDENKSVVVNVAQNPSGNYVSSYQSTYVSSYDGSKPIWQIGSNEEKALQQNQMRSHTHNYSDKTVTSAQRDYTSGFSPQITGWNPPNNTTVVTSGYGNSTPVPLSQTNTVPFCLNLVQDIESFFLPVGAILMRNGPQSKDATGMVSPFYQGRSLLLCDGRKVPACNYPLLAQILGVDTSGNMTLPDYVTYGVSLYGVGNQGNFCLTLNTLTFDPTTLSNATYTKWWVQGFGAAVSAQQIADKFKVSVDVVKYMNGGQDSFADYSLVNLPNVQSVLSQLYYRTPIHTHTGTYLNGDNTKDAFNSPGVNKRTFMVQADDQNNVPTSTVGDNQPFNGQRATIAVAYYILGDYTSCGLV